LAKEIATIATISEEVSKAPQARDRPYFDSISQHRTDSAPSKSQLSFGSAVSNPAGGAAGANPADDTAHTPSLASASYMKNRARTYADMARHNVSVMPPDKSSSTSPLPERPVISPPPSHERNANSIFANQVERTTSVKPPAKSPSVPSPSLVEPVISAPSSVPLASPPLAVIAPKRTRTPSGLAPNSTQTRPERDLSELSYSSGERGRKPISTDQGRALPSNAHLPPERVSDKEVDSKARQAEEGMASKSKRMPVPAPEAETKTSLEGPRKDPRPPPASIIRRVDSSHAIRRSNSSSEIVYDTGSRESPKRPAESSRGNTMDMKPSPMPLPSTFKPSPLHIVRVPSNNNMMVPDVATRPLTSDGVRVQEKSKDMDSGPSDRGGRMEGLYLIPLYRCVADFFMHVTSSRNCSTDDAKATALCENGAFR
jgi:hypothetical protein